MQIHPEHFPSPSRDIPTSGVHTSDLPRMEDRTKVWAVKTAIDPPEWHVRGFVNGMLDSEVEISRNWLQHIAAKPGPYYSPLLRILDRIGITFSVVGGIPPDAAYVYLPELFGQMIPVQVPSITF